MKHDFNIVRISVKGGEGIAAQAVEWMHVPEEDLAVSRELEVFGTTFCVQYIDAERMDFTFGEHQYALARRGIDWNPPSSMNRGVIFD